MGLGSGRVLEALGSSAVVGCYAASFRLMVASELPVWDELMF